MTTPGAPGSFGSVGIVGLGLIGGSLARAFASAGVSVHGCDPDGATRRDAEASGVCASVSNSLGDLLDRPVDLIYICTPVHVAHAVMDELAVRGETRPVTDAASTKGTLVEHARSIGLNYCGGHPIAGRETSGFAAGDEKLFAGAHHILTPAGDAALVPALTELHEKIDMRVTVMDASRHDTVFGMVSHLPHVTAFALVETLMDIDPEVLAYTGGGFRDFTRIAASDPTMWSDIFLDNKATMTALIDAYIERLARWKKMIQSDNRKDLMSSIDTVAGVRRSL